MLVKAILATLSQLPVQGWYDGAEIPPGGRFPEEIQNGVLTGVGKVRRRHAPFDVGTTFRVNGCPVPRSRRRLHLPRKIASLCSGSVLAVGDVVAFSNT